MAGGQLLQKQLTSISSCSWMITVISSTYLYHQLWLESSCYKSSLPPSPAVAGGQLLQAQLISISSCGWRPPVARAAHPSGLQLWLGDNSYKLNLSLQYCITSCSLRPSVAKSSLPPSLVVTGWQLFQAQPISISSFGWRTASARAAYVHLQL